MLDAKPLIEYVFVMMIALLLAAVLGAAVKPEAQQLARRSIVEYNAGEFEKALADATRAYEIAPIPALLYNLGQCHRVLHHWERAAFFYRGYLRGKPTAGNRSEVRALIAEMEANDREEKADRRSPQRASESAPLAVPMAIAPAPSRQPAPLAAAPAPLAAPASVLVVPSAALAAEAPPANHTASWLLGTLGAVGAVSGAAAWLLMTEARSGYYQASQSSGLDKGSYASFKASNTEAIVGDVLVPLGAALIATALGVAIFGSAPAAEASR